MKTELDVRQQEFVDTMNSINDWNEKFDYIIALGFEVDELPDVYRTAVNQIENCLSRTYLTSKVEDSGVVRISAWSNGVIPQALCGVVSSIFSGISYQEIKDSKIFFHIDSGLMDHLTAQRSGALEQMINRVLLSIPESAYTSSKDSDNELKVLVSDEKGVVIDPSTATIAFEVRVESIVMEGICSPTAKTNCYIGSMDREGESIPCLVVTIQSGTFPAGIVQLRVCTKESNENFQDGYKDTWGDWVGTNLRLV